VEIGPGFKKTLGIKTGEKLPGTFFKLIGGLHFRRNPSLAQGEFPLVFPGGFFQKFKKVWVFRRPNKVWGNFGKIGGREKSAGWFRVEKAVLKKQGCELFFHTLCATGL